MSHALPNYLRKMVCRPVPDGVGVVLSSTPVVSFGAAGQARVATVGLNPSKNEFVDRSGALLVGTNRRLATLDSLGVASLDLLTDAHVEQVIEDCNAYFQRQPYRRWFDPLDEVLRAGTDASYYDGSACHLDLVQWATDPVWSQISARSVREQLLKEGVPHLRALLENSTISLLLLNGRAVVEQFERCGLGTLQPDPTTLVVGRVRCILFRGRAGEIRVLGWSTNLQSSFGVSREFRAELAGWVREHAGEGSADPDERLPLDGPQFIAQDLDAVGLIDLARRLREWLRQSPAATIGDAGSYGRRAWLRVNLPDGSVAVLNADTTRLAVQAYVAEVDKRGANQAWSVIANRSGMRNKVTFRADGRPTAGWYCYIVR